MGIGQDRADENGGLGRPTYSNGPIFLPGNLQVSAAALLGQSISHLRAIDLADRHGQLFDSARLDGPVVDPIDLESRPLLSTQTASCRLRFDDCSRLQPSIAAESVSAGQIEERS